jgi:hypothetical protein
VGGLLAAAWAGERRTTMTSVRYKYACLEDFLISVPLSVDGKLDENLVKILA